MLFSDRSSVTVLAVGEVGDILEAPLSSLIVKGSTLLYKHNVFRNLAVSCLYLC